MTTVLIAVDASDASVHAVETAHRLFGDDADYLVLNVGGGTYVPVTIFPGEMGLVSPLAWAPVVQSQLAAEDLRNDSGATDVISDAEAAETIAKQTGEEGGLSGATALGIVGDAAGSIIEVAVEHERQHAEHALRGPGLRDQGRAIRDERPDQREEPGSEIGRGVRSELTPAPPLRSLPQIVERDQC